MRRLVIGVRLSTTFPWTATTFPWTATTFPWTATTFPWTATTLVGHRLPVSSRILRYFFGRRNPYFCMR